MSNFITLKELNQFIVKNVIWYYKDGEDDKDDKDDI